MQKRATRLASSWVHCLLLLALTALVLGPGCRETSRRVAFWEGPQGRVSGESMRVKVEKARYLGSLSALALSEDDLKAEEFSTRFGSPTEVLREDERLVRTYVLWDDEGQEVSRLDTIANSHLYRFVLTVEQPDAAVRGNGFTWGGFPLAVTEAIVRARLGEPNLPEPPAERGMVYSFFVDRREGRIFLVAEYLFTPQGECPSSVSVSIYYEEE